MTDFTHDVAVSAVSYDALFVAELCARLAERLSTAAFWRPERADMRPDPVTELDAAAVMSASARVVVVLHQRLWGREGSNTASDAAALRDRVRARKQKSICVITLDDAPLPTWLKSASSCVMTDVGLEGAVEAVSARVMAAGGKLRPVPVAEPVVPPTVWPVWTEGHQTFMSQPRAQSALKREFDMLTSELADRVKSESDRGGDERVEMHCAPQRLIVQLGPVGLSMSWVASRSGNLADGRLLVIEWEGAITHARHMGAGGSTASPLREQVYRPEAKGPDDWCWRPEGGEALSYSSRNLAGQCFTSANMGRTA